MPGTVVSMKNTAVNKNLCIYRTSILVLELDNKDKQEKSVIYKIEIKAKK